MIRKLTQSLFLLPILAGYCSAQNPTATPADWSWMPWGTGIGATGMTSTQIGGVTELVCGGGGISFYGNRYWFLVRYDKVSKGLKPVWSSPVYPKNESPQCIVAGDILGNGSSQVLVARGGGKIELWLQKNRLLATTIQTKPQVISGLSFANLDGKGANEILVTDTKNLYAYDLKGKELWSVMGIGGDTAIGNLDKDKSLELVSSSGSVLDLDTRKVQWTWKKGFGFDVEVADIDGDKIDELVAADAWSWVWAFDVDKQLPKWSIKSTNTGAIRLSDVDKDGTIELIIGHAQWGYEICYDTKTQKEEWKIRNPEHGTTDVIATDIDGDGQNDIIWGAGYSSTGKDQIFLGDWKKQVIRWRSTHLDGPFSQALRGDVDGDGKDEIVAVSRASDSGYSGARILVFDGTSYDLRHISQPISSSGFSGVTPSLQLLNVDSDKALEIIVQSDRLQVWDYSSNGTFTKSWELYPGYSNRIYSFLMADLDGKSGLEVAVGTSQFLYTYDYATKKQLTKSFYLGGYVRQILLADPDQDKKQELIARSSDGNLYIFDAATAVAEKILQPALGRKFMTTSVLPLAPGVDVLVTTNDQGAMSLHLAWKPSGYLTLGPIPTSANKAYDSFHILDANLFMLWAKDGVITVSSGFTPIWKTKNYGTSFGQNWVVGSTQTSLRLLSSSSFGIFGFDF